MVDNTMPCPHCKRAVGEHTIDEYTACLQEEGFDYELPHEDIPGGPMRMPDSKGYLVGEVSVAAATYDTALGTMPCIRFIFTGPGEGPMERRSLDPIVLLMDPNGLMAMARLVDSSVKSAIRAIGPTRGAGKHG